MESATATLTLSLPQELEQELRQRAAATGKDVNALALEAIEDKLRAASMTFAQIMEPVRREFEESGMTEEELDRLIKEAREEARQQRNRNSQP